jgi:hypothetical protein
MGKQPKLLKQCENQSTLLRAISMFRFDGFHGVEVREQRKTDINPFPLAIFDNSYLRSKIIMHGEKLSE